MRTNNRLKSQPERQQVLQSHRTKRKQTEKAKELPTRQLIDESEQEEEEPLVRRTVKRGTTKTSSNLLSKGIEIGEPVPHQSKSSKQSDPKDKGKQKATAESKSESDSDDELRQVDMSDEDEGEPIDRADWEKNFENDDMEAKDPGPYDVTHVLEPNKGRSSKLTIQQLFEQMQADMKENKAELIATRAELSATRAELIQTHADLSRVQAEQVTVMREVSLLLRALVQNTDIDISQLLASSTAGPSTSAPPIVPEAPSFMPTEAAVSHATDSAPIGDDRTVTKLPIREDAIARPEGAMIDVVGASSTHSDVAATSIPAAHTTAATALSQTAEEPSTLT
ncbi:hypothetical protein A4A49_25237 [Nicotiana attenuata]|uniref:Uncharacterized protein n=1 Tax=Nicotiana attenuata TaxID=49451 RepID=A0A1J6IS18_NICAT|nr:hypothetical protein A4A49_25237 [Nicotiana attenuata]